MHWGSAIEFDFAAKDTGAGEPRPASSRLPVLVGSELVVEPAPQIGGSAGSPPGEEFASPLVDRPVFCGNQRSQEAGDVGIFGPVEPVGEKPDGRDMVVDSSQLFLDFGDDGVNLLSHFRAEGADENLHRIANSFSADAQAV